MPLWQLTHVFGAIPVWANVAGTHVVERWQLSHDAVVIKCFAGLPLAVDPL
jgi:hypothetical protein